MQDDELHIDFMAYPQHVKLMNGKRLKGHMEVDDAMQWFNDNVVPNEGVFDQVRLKRTILKISDTLGIKKITVKENK